MIVVGESGSEEAFKVLEISSSHAIRWIGTGLASFRAVNVSV